MRRSRRSRSSFVVPWAAILASLLLLIGLASGACRKEEPAEETPAETTAGPEATTETPAETPAAGEEITILAFNIEWDPADANIAKGDTIIWKMGADSGFGHGLRFPDATVCATAKQKMTFDPPLEGCQSAKKTKKDEVIVKATVNENLTGDLKYDCRVHKEDMEGTLKPK